LLAAVALSASAADGDFRWSWEASGKPPQTETGSTAGSGFNWGWQAATSTVAATPAPEAPPAAPAVSPPGSTQGEGGRISPSAYNELLKENLELRRRLTDAATDEARVARENERLTKEIRALEVQIATLASTVQDLKQKQPDPSASRELETRLAAAESEKKRLQEQMATLARESERRKASAEIASAPPKPAEGGAVLPGSDLFRQVERENLDLRQKLAKLESEHGQAVETQKRVAEDEARARASVTQLTDREKELRAALETMTAKAKEQERKHEELLQKMPQLESDLARRSGDAQTAQTAIAEKDRQIEVLQDELRRREHRLAKAERMAALLDQARQEVKQVNDREKRDMHYNMAAIYARDGRAAEAVQEYLKALQIDPSDADIHYNLGILYDEDLRDKRKAAMHYRRYLQLRPHGADADQVKTWLMAIDLRR
jgi:tetratricopeptide (TPR) repeat protein